MNNWWKGALLGAGALGLTALTGGTAAGPLAGLLGGAGEGAAAGAGAAGAGEAAAAGTAGAEAAGAAAATPGATAFVTQPVTGLLSGGGELSGSLAGTDMAYGGSAALADAPAVTAPTMMQQAGSYASMAGKAAGAYGTVNAAMGGNQPHAAPPAPQPIFQGQAPQINPGMLAPQPNQFAQMLLAQRQRGMLG